MSDFDRGTRRFDDVEAASFSADGTGLTVTEDGGDWVAKDDVGNVVLRYDEAAGDWVMDSLSTDNLFSASKFTNAVVWKDGSGTWHADGPDNELDSGPDVGSVIQSAINTSGVRSVYAVDVDPSTVSVTLPNNDHTVYYQYDGSLWQECANHRGIKFWGTGKDGDYQDISWYPEQSSSGQGAAYDADVTITAHKKRFDGTVDRELSIYTANAAFDDTPKRFNLRYGQDFADADFTAIGNFGVGAQSFQFAKSTGPGTRQGAEMLSHREGGSGEALFRIDPREYQTDAGAQIDLFRGVDTSGKRAVNIHKGDGTSNTQVQFDIANNPSRITIWPRFATGSPIRFQQGALAPSGAGFGSSPEDLSGKTGSFDGEMRIDDGTNTAARGTMCVWDGTNSVWRPSNSPSNGSFT
jgi:hypothetical protein